MRNARDAVLAAAAGSESTDTAMRVLSEESGVLAVGLSLWRDGVVLLGQAWHGIPSAFFHAYSGSFRAQDPWSQRIHQLATGHMVGADDIVPREAFRCSAFYQELCRPHGVQDLCGGVLLRAGSFTVTFGLLRAGDASGRGEREAAVASALLPHLTCLARAEVDRMRLATTTALVSTCPFGVYVLHAERRTLLDTNPAGERLLKDGLVVFAPGEVRVDGERVELGPPGNRLRAVSRARGVRISATPAVPLRNELVRRLYVHYAPFVARERVAHAVVAYGLSPREASVAEHLLLGKAPKEIAALHGVAVSTLRTQMRALYAKLGVDRQASLVARLTEV